MCGWNGKSAANDGANLPFYNHIFVYVLIRRKDIRESKFKRYKESCDMAKESLSRLIITTFMSVLIYGLVQDYLSRNYPETNPIWLAAIAATIAAVIIYIIFKRKVEA